MPFCTHCGSQLSEGDLCPTCGRKADQFRPQLPVNTAAALCYIPGLILAIMFLWWNPYRRPKIIRFHAWQAILLQSFWIAVMVVIGMLFSLFAAPLWFFIERLLHLAFILLTAFMIIQTYRNQTVVLPYLGAFAEKSS